MTTAPPATPAPAATRKSVPSAEPFVFKVMRLPCPSFRSSSALSWQVEGSGSGSDSGDGSGGEWREGEQRWEDERAAAVGIPSVMGSVYAGERFRAAVSISCNVEAGVAQMAVRVELQSASRRSSLLDLSSSTSSSSPSFFPTFSSDGHASYVVADVLVEPGLHCLVCSVSYHDSSGPSVPASSAPLTYQKYFKFNVLSALSVSSVLHARDDWLLAELAITNATARPLSISKVQIDTRSEQAMHAESDAGGGDSQTGIASLPSSSSSSSASLHFAVRPIVAPPSVGSSPLCPAVDALLAPSATRTFLFRIDPLSVDSRRVADIGRVSVEWRQQMGELCQLAAACAVHRTAKTSSAQMAPPTQPVNTMPPSATAATPPTAFPALPSAPSAARPSDVSLQLLSCPATAVLERPFPVRLLLSNPLPVPLQRCQLLLMRDKMGSVLPVGRSRLFVGSSGEKGLSGGTVQPHSSHTVELSLAGIGLGVHKIGGIRVIAHSSSVAAPAIQLDFDALQQIEIVAHD